MKHFKTDLKIKKSNNFKELSNEIYYILKELGYCPFWHDKSEMQLNCVINECKFFLYGVENETYVDYLAIFELKKPLNLNNKNEINNIVNKDNSPFERIIYDDEKLHDLTNNYIYLYNCCEIKEFSYSHLKNIIDVITKINYLIKDLYTISE